MVAVASPSTFPAASGVPDSRPAASSSLSRRGGFRMFVDESSWGSMQVLQTTGE